MDAVFARFQEIIGDPIDRREVPAFSIERYRGKLPDQLLTYWIEHGWCGYGQGIFWIVDPQEYEGVVASWIKGTELEYRDNYHLIARGAFGDLYLWGEKTGCSLEIASVVSRCVVSDTEIAETDKDREIQDFLLRTDAEFNDLENLFDKARKKFGALKYDEMYGLVPAFMLGGDIDLKHLKKLKAVEHLTFLSQLAELTPYDF